MGEIINKQFEEYQDVLKKKEKKLKPIFNFDRDERIDELMNDLNQKNVIL